MQREERARAGGQSARVGGFTVCFMGLGITEHLGCGALAAEDLGGLFLGGSMAALAGRLLVWFGLGAGLEVLGVNDVRILRTDYGWLC
jgi:hypothetical protein